MTTPPGGLGFRKESDVRSLSHLVSTITPTPHVPKTRHWTMPIPPADQKMTGACTGFAAWHRLVTTPIAMDPTRIPTAFDIYRAGVLLDQFADNDQDATAADADCQAGGSTLGVMKALKQFRLISRYAWAYTGNDVIIGVGYHGPVTIGVAWFTSFDSPTPEGFVGIEPGATIRGGHEVLVLGWDQKRGVAECLNSWGSGFAKGGKFYMSGETLAELIEKYDGEGAVAVEVRQGA